MLSLKMTSEERITAILELNNNDKYKNYYTKLTKL